MQTPAFLPTPDEIRRECERIRETWDDREHYVRAGRRVPSHLARGEDRPGLWTVPAVRIAADGPVEPDGG